MNILNNKYILNKQKYMYNIIKYDKISINYNY